MTLNELKKTKAGQLPSNRRLLEDAIIRHGPRADVLSVGLMAKPITQPDAAGALVEGVQKRQGRPDRVDLRVALVRFGEKQLDDDNLKAGFKPLRDAIAASLGVDDGDKRIEWITTQCTGTGVRGTLVLIN